MEWHQYLRLPTLKYEEKKKPEIHAVVTNYWMIIFLGGDLSLIFFA